jgi:DNA-binding HxlR family transcriptional regulator
VSADVSDGNHWVSGTSTCYKYLMVTIARRPAPPLLLQRLRAERVAREVRSGAVAEGPSGAVAEGPSGAVAEDSAAVTAGPAAIAAGSAALGPAAVAAGTAAGTADRSPAAAEGSAAGGTAPAEGSAPGDLAPDLLSPDCPTRRVLDRIGDKWTVLVVLLLSDGPMRFSELRTSLGQVAPKVLTQTLRRMERDGLLSREVFAEVPPRVEYALTALGHSLITPIATIADWAETNVGRITAAQAAYDAGRATS